MKYSILVFSLMALVVISPVFAEVDSPRKQIKNGVPFDKILCKEGLVLVERSNGVPACVYENTALSLESRGWGIVYPSIENMHQNS